MIRRTRGSASTASLFDLFTSSSTRRPIVPQA
jgi:hypothetical protein